MFKNTETSQSPSSCEGSDTIETQKIDIAINRDLCYRKKPVYSFFKRFFDIVNSSLAILVLLPLLLSISLLVACTSKGPVFYKHLRMGRNGKPFFVLKFRSMVWDPRPIEQQLDSEQLKQFQTQFKVDDDPRITMVGKFLRRTSLDELPQLFNIFIGQMSVVGPRPIIAIELEKYGTKKSLLLSIRPGLTSYWACHGRSKVSYQERMNMELHYVMRRSLWLDFKIICRTIISVFLQDGVK